MIISRTISAQCICIWRSNSMRGSICCTTVCPPFPFPFPFPSLDAFIRDILIFDSTRMHATRHNTTPHRRPA